MSRRSAIATGPSSAMLSQLCRAICLKGASQKRANRRLKYNIANCFLSNFACYGTCDWLPFWH
eukprot:3285868-Amphidinium_carterae.1